MVWFFTYFFSSPYVASPRACCSLSLLVGRELQPNIRVLGLLSLRPREFRIILFIFEPQVELLTHVWDKYLQILLSESFAKAYTLAAMEWNPAATVAFLSIRSQVKRAGLVKSLGQKLHRTLPLSCTVANILKTKAELVSLLELVLSKFHIFSSFVYEACIEWRHNPETLLHYHGSIF